MLQRLLVKWVIGCGIYEAAQAGDIYKVRALLAIDPILAKRREAKRPLTPLHLAAMQDNIPLAELLLAYGADINAIDPLTGRTPLHLAAHHGSRQITSYLLMRGADRQAIDNSGLTPLQVAERAQKRAVVDLLLSAETQQHADD